MGQRQFSVPSAPPVTPLKGEGSNEHTLSTFSTFNEYTDSLSYFIYSLLPGLDWIERENFLDVHLTRNRPPPARRRRSGPTQRTSFRRAGQTQRKIKMKCKTFKLCSKISCGQQFLLIYCIFNSNKTFYFQTCHHPAPSPSCINSTQLSVIGRSR